MVSFSNPPSSSSKKLYGRASQALASELVSQTRPLAIQALEESRLRAIREVYQKIVTFFTYRQGLEESEMK